MEMANLTISSDWRSAKLRINENLVRIELIGPNDFMGDEWFLREMLFSE